MQELNGGEVLVNALLSREVDTVFFVAGGTYVTVLEALSRQTNKIRSVPTRLESSAVFAAETYAAVNKKPACVFVSRAPGASNAVIGIHTAMQASRPLVLFVANIPRGQKQREAFQEIDVNAVFGSQAKAVFDVADFDDLGKVVARALDLSVSGRPGPVVVSVAKDILDGITGDPDIPPVAAPVRFGAQSESIAHAAKLIDGAAKPLLVAGEMVSFDQTHGALAKFAEKTGVAVVAAYRQQDIMANDHPAWLGQLTLNRTPHIERAIEECDLMICVGTRLDSVTSAEYSMISKDKTLIMVYPDADVFSQWQPTVAMASDTRSALEQLTAACQPAASTRLAWRDAAHTAEARFADSAGVETQGAVNMARVLDTFQALVPADTITVADAGTFGRWLARYYCYRAPDTALGPVSGAMGYGVPGGVGAAIATRDRKDGAPPVVVWVGDGGFLMTGHEAATIVQEKLPVIIVVCDNSAWGSIMTHQEKRFPGWTFGTHLKSPDFAQLGRGYGMAAFTVASSEEFGPALEEALATRGPALIHLLLDARDVSPFKPGEA